MTLLITAALVVLVIFIFLRNVTATLIPALALPVSIIGTFAGMELLGYSIDNLSLMALTLSVGFVVDDAIVMLENIMRHVEGGERVIDAAFRGSREIAFTILSITLSLVAVFIPVLFMGGVVGRVFREFAVTISLTILISGFVSLTLTPMLASRLIKAHHGEHHNVAYRLFERGFDALLSGYKAGLSTVMRWRRTTLFITICSIALSGYLFAIVPKGFFPIVDTGVLIGSTEAAQDISMQAMAEHTLDVARVIKADPNVERRHRLRRRRRQQPVAEHRAALHPAQAARRARPVGDPGDSGTATQGGARRRHEHLLPAVAGHQSRRASVEEPVPIHAAGRQHGRALQLCRARWRAACAGSPASRT